MLMKMCDARLRFSCVHKIPRPKLAQIEITMWKSIGQIKWCSLMAEKVLTHAIRWWSPTLCYRPRESRDHVVGAPSEPVESPLKNQHDQPVITIITERDRLIIVGVERVLFERQGRAVVPFSCAFSLGGPPETATIGQGRCWVIFSVV
jgi:hypothetical protein